MGAYAEWTNDFFEDLLKWISKRGITTWDLKDFGWSGQIREKTCNCVVQVKPVSTYAEHEDLIYDIGIKVSFFKKGEFKTNKCWTNFRK